MLTDLDPEFFKVIEDHERKLRLIIPNHSAACANTIWTNQNKWYRSRVEALNGDTVSQGFSKFLNLGQDNPDIGVSAHDIVAAIHNNERVVATLKYDGSCLIRSVYDGKVIFRTRGSLQHGFHDNAEQEISTFGVRYPRLLDPSWMADKSLLFEWVTPDFQIVIKYDKAELHLIGGVDHGHRHYSHLRYLTVDELEDIAADGGLVMMEYFIIDNVKDWFNFYHEVQNHKEIEGYVIRLDDEQTLTKVKSQPYLVKHGLKSNLSFKSMIEFWLQHGRGSGEEMVRQLETMYDEEVVMWALPFVVEVEEAIEAWETALADVRKEVNSRGHWSRKDFAIEMQKIFKHDRSLFSLAMLIWQDQEIPDRMIRNFMQQFDKDQEDGQ